MIMKACMLFLIGINQVFSVPCPSDISGGKPHGKDGQVNVEDLISILGDYGTTQKRYDIVPNGKVDVEDVLLVLKNFGRTDCDKPTIVKPPVSQVKECPNSPKQVCRMICPKPSLSCTTGQCLMRVGTCCQFKCHTLNQGGCGKYPCDCVQWYDGCNTCGIQKGVLGMCTSRACLKQGIPYCKRYKDGRVCDGADTNCNPPFPIIPPPPPPPSPPPPPPSPPPSPSPGEVVIGRPFLHKNLSYLMADVIYTEDDWFL